MKSPISGRPDPERQFRSQLAVVVRTLERAIQDVLRHFWEEPLRRHALSVASTLLEGSKTYGFLELASVARAIISLLSLPMEDVLSLENSLREKFAELLELLKEIAEIVAA